MAADHPRIRGEHSKTRRSRARRTGSSPHTRGAPAGVVIDAHHPGIIPAYAGSTCEIIEGSSPGPDHPRIRGEHPDSVIDHCPTGGSSPHTRGAREIFAAHCASYGIIPAYAGSTPILHVRSRKQMDHPRIRGEHAWRVGVVCEARGSSPHTRGARAFFGVSGGPGGIIPAYAGSTAMSAMNVWKAWDHPRIRGEHCCWGALTLPPGGSSPHTRGALPCFGAVGLVAGIIPAYAGSTTRLSHKTHRHPDHPPIRGEHSNPMFTTGSTLGSSPHTRGAREAAAEHGLWERIIPAYAGSTLRSFLEVPGYRDHPRIRGEHGLLRVS